MSTTPTIPAAAPTPAPSSAPAVPSTPAPAAPTATPAAGVPPSSGPTPPARPDGSRFSSASEYLGAEIKYKQELAAFEEANPGVKPAEPAATPAATEESAPVTETAAPAVDETKPADGETQQPEAETKPVEDDDPIILADEPAVTPQGLNEIFKGDEAIKAAFEANPAAKNAVMKMAREHAELSQFKGIFPNAESAKFSRDTANRTVALRSAFQSADTPEGMASAFDAFTQEFAVMGPDGQPMKDEHGEPVFADDLYAFGEHMVNDRYLEGVVRDVQAELESPNTNEARKVQLQDYLTAVEILRERDFGAEAKGQRSDPDLSSLAPDVRADVESRLNEAKRIEAQNKERDKGAGKQSREALRKTGTQEFFQRSAARLWPQVDRIVEKLRGAGAVIPDFQIKTTMPGSNVSLFQNEIGKQVQAFVKADPYIADHMTQLEVQYLNSPTPENMESRVKYFDSILQSKDDSGRSLVNRIVSGLIHQSGISASESKPASVAPPRAEPKPGTAVAPKPLTADEAYRQAETQLAKERPDWQNKTRSERMAETMTRQRQLLARR